MKTVNKTSVGSYKLMNGSDCHLYKVNGVDNMYTFEYKGFLFIVFEHDYLEFNIYAPNKDWRRFFLRRMDSIDKVEYMEIGASLLIKIAGIDKIAANE